MGAAYNQVRSIDRKLRYSFMHHSRNKMLANSNVFFFIWVKLGQVMKNACDLKFKYNMLDVAEKIHLRIESKLWSKDRQSLCERSSLQNISSACLITYQWHTQLATVGSELFTSEMRIWCVHLFCTAAVGYCPSTEHLSPPRWNPSWRHAEISKCSCGEDVAVCEFCEREIHKGWNRFWFRSGSYCAHLDFAAICEPQNAADVVCYWAKWSSPSKEAGLSWAWAAVVSVQQGSSSLDQRWVIIIQQSSLICAWRTLLFAKSCVLLSIEDQKDSENCCRNHVRRFFCPLKTISKLLFFASLWLYCKTVFYNC